MSPAARRAASSTSLALKSVVTDRGPNRRDRRVSQSRRSMELVLDSIFRPARWAARLSYAIGGQGRVAVRVDRIRSGAHPRLLRPVRIAFASDFHAGPTTDPRLLEQACRALSALEPDLLLLGGDFVSVRAAYVGELTRLLDSVNASCGRFAVLGNHDLRADRAHIAAQLASSGIDLLENRQAAVMIDGVRVVISGLDDPTRGVPRPDLAMQGAATIRVVLMHSPDGVLSIGSRHYDLALCGHTHGGQIATPGGTPIVLPHGRLSRRYSAGRFEFPSEHHDSPRVLIVSRGVGCSTVPLRLFAPPEVHLLLVE